LATPENAEVQRQNFGIFAAMAFLHLYLYLLTVVLTKRRSFYAISRRIRRNCRVHVDQFLRCVHVRAFNLH